jgi:hypothetical protein
MSIYIKKILVGIGLAACFLGTVSVPASAQLGVNIHLGPQPPPRREFIGRAPRRDCTWRRGHYVPRGNHWLWVPGRWICRR